MCKEFRCLPSAWRQEPDFDGLLQVLECRAYARAYNEVDAAEKPEDVPHTPLHDKVLEIEAQLGMAWFASMRAEEEAADGG